MPAFGHTAFSHSPPSVNYASLLRAGPFEVAWAAYGWVGKSFDAGFVAGGCMYCVIVGALRFSVQLPRRPSSGKWWARALPSSDWRWARWEAKSMRRYGGCFGVVANHFR